MPILSLDFNTLTAANPYPIGSAPDNLTGYSVVTGANPGKIYSAAPKVWSMASGTNAMWRNDTLLTGNVIKVSVQLTSPVTSSSIGCAFVNYGNDGLMVITGTGTNNFRIFAVLDGQLSGSALWTQATAPIANATIEFRRTFTGGNYEYEVFQNGVKVGTTYTNNTYNTDMYGATVSRGGDLKTFSVEYTPAQTIDTITNPLIPESAFSGTQTGFANGAVTVTTPVIGGGTVSSSATISGGTYSGTYATPVSGSAYPLFGSTQTHTFTQGALTATISSVIGNPTGFSRVTLSSPITDDLSYITANFNVTPVTGDLVFYETADFISFAADGTTEVASEIVTQIVHQVASTGVVYIYEFTINDAGQVVDVKSLTSIGLSSVGLTSTGLTSVGL